MTASVLRRILDAWREQISREVELALAAFEAELRDELHTELAAITRRIDAVHERALRALTHTANRKD